MSTMLSRSGRSGTEGKLTHRFDIPVSEDLHDSVIALATIHGISKAEWLRNLIEEAVHGRLSMVRRVSRPMRSGESEESGTDNP